MLKRCEDTNLCLNREKSRFMVKEGIVLGHKISKQGIEVDKAKVKNKQEKEKIGTKPDKNRKRGEAREKFKAVTVDREGKTEQNAKTMVKNACTVKECQEKDKIGSKPNKNEKRGEAEKSQKQLQWIEEEKLKKTQKEGPEMQTHASFKRRKKRIRTRFAF
nr:reverse transcriptase [Tanacetum cinerariifolium]